MSGPLDRVLDRVKRQSLAEQQSSNALGELLRPSAPPGDEDAGLAHLRGAQTPQGRLQAWMLEDTSISSSEAVRLEAEKEALDRKRHALDMREQHLLRSQGTAAGDEAVAQRVLHQVQEEKQEQDMLFSQWRAEVQEARAELHDQMRNSIRKDFAEARENQLYQEIHFQSQQLKRLNEARLGPSMASLV
eukprot:g13139.t1